ncbi:MAG TPA: site-specific DNA-methyltransferase, partial [Ignavibacteriales bacterium]|nr:site-specific DNA-methyltransferase [Ignavibacteriales bacterium]
METQYEKLKKILRQMFQMDQADLDFGIYRIMNQKRDEIEHFLDKELLPQVKQEFGKYKDVEAEKRQKELEKLIKTLEDADVDPDTNPKVLKIKEEMAAYGDEESLASEVFSHLTTFFRRYYDNGDFLSLRRYKKDTYAIPYEGEDVKLHWANADQYYIKSSEYLRDYVFKLPGQKRVHFKLIDATEEKDNIKQEQGKERRFRLCDSEPIKIEADDLYVQFTYLPDNTKQADLNKETLEYIISVQNKTKEIDNFHKLFELMPTPKNPNRTLLEKHLNNYTARFNFDFFIHKDLSGFLRRELDFYIKNEVLFIDDLDEQDERKVIQSVGKVKVLKHIAQKIISLLAQIEDFQKKLWLKKKFVVDCGYCVTLDRVPEDLYDEIAKNDGQREEWVRLFAINEIKKDLTNPGYTKPLTVKFLKANPFLIVDTNYFNDAFTEKLLASIDNIDEACDGVIINSENFQALNLLLEKYREQVKCVYIDPPYNT